MHYFFYFKSTPKNDYTNQYQKDDDEKHLEVMYHLYEEYKPPLEYETKPPIIMQTIPHYSINNNYYHPSLSHNREQQYATNSYGTTHTYSKVYIFYKILIWYISLDFVLKHEFFHSTGKIPNSIVLSSDYFSRLSAFEVIL